MSNTFTTPVGRLVAGSFYNPNTKNAEGKPLTDKAGNPRVEYYIALAIPKAGEAHWKDTPWGQAIWTAGVTGDPQAPNRRVFSWKVIDGDSAEVDTKGRRPRDREGYPGHWVLRFSSGFAPDLYTTVTSSTPIPLPQKDAIRPGDYIQVQGNVRFNGSSQQPGVYLNFGMACLCGYGKRIVIGPDVSSAGFGASPLPAGAMTAPEGGAMPPAPAPVAPVAPVAPALPPVPPPAPAFRQVHQMTAKAGGATYEAMVAVGWTDALLVQEGYMLA